MSEILTTTPQEELIAAQAEQFEQALPVAHEQIEEPNELVESFIDRNGVERRVGEVLLNREAKEAIESYFEDHNHLAEAIDQQLDDLALIRTEQQNYINGNSLVGLAQNKGDKNFSAHTYSSELANADNTLKNEVFQALGLDKKQEDIASDDPSKVEAASLSEEDKKLLELEQRRATLKEKITAIRDHADKHQFNSDGSGMAAQTAKSLVETLPKGLKGEVEEQGTNTDLGLKARFSSNYRREVANNIHLALDTLAGQAQNEIQSIDAKIMTEMTGQVMGVVRDNLNSLDIRVEHSSENEGHIIERELGDVRNVNQVVERHGQQLNGVAEEVKKVISAEDVIQESLSNSFLAEFVQRLPEDKQLALAQSLLAGLRLGEVVAPEQREQINVLMGTTAHNSINTAARVLSVATRAIYAERALPVKCISDQEVAKLQELYDKLNEVTGQQETDNSKEIQHAGIRTTAADHIKQIKGSVEQYRGDRVLYHATAYAKQIIESGALMTIEEQANRLGAVHVTTGHRNDDLSTRHSTVPHFGTEPVGNYIGSRDKDIVRGVVAVPVAEVIQRAPINRAGYMMTELPLTSNDFGDGITHNHATNKVDMYDDYVFFGSEDGDASDNYVLPIAGGEVFVVDETSDIQVPSEISDRVHAVQPSNLNIPIDAAVKGQIMRTAEERAHATHGNTLVIPLRRSALPIEYTETPEGNTVTQRRRKMDLSNAAKVMRTGLAR